jgi:hypothetical protein
MKLRLGRMGLPLSRRPYWAFERSRDAKRNFQISQRELVRRRRQMDVPPPSLDVPKLPVLIPVHAGASLAQALGNFFLDLISGEDDPPPPNPEDLN